MMILIQDNVSQQLSRNRLILTQHARSLYENSNTSLDDSEAMRKLRQVQGLELSIPNTLRNMKCMNLRLGKGKANKVVLHVTLRSRGRAWRGCDAEWQSGGWLAKNNRKHKDRAIL